MFDSSSWLHEYIRGVHLFVTREVYVKDTLNGFEYVTNKENENQQ